MIAALIMIGTFTLISIILILVLWTKHDYLETKIHHQKRQIATLSKQVRQINEYLDDVDHDLNKIVDHLDSE